MNFLLPHIRRMPEKLARDQFAADAAQKLGIDSAVLREELRQAALRRRDHVEVRATGLTEVERVLLRALAIEIQTTSRCGRSPLTQSCQQPAWFEQLSIFPALQALAMRQASDPMEVVDDPAQRALLAEALLKETRPPDENEVASSIQQIQERAIESRLRELRGLIAEAERRGDVARIGGLDERETRTGQGIAATSQSTPAGTLVAQSCKLRLRIENLRRISSVLRLNNRIKGG